VNKYLDINFEVQAALADSGPVLAFESTIISHGMPYPQNLETALAVEQAARDHGATPATIAIMDGRIKIGLSQDELESLAKNGEQSTKTSRRDIPFVLNAGGYATTTVAATMICADLAGIRVFSTGGIGGVHRGAGETFDVSADLEELATSNVAVVCAGAKAILDIGLTLEYLETKGVAVVGYQTSELPAFYSRDSGFSVDYRGETPAEIAAALKTKWDLNLQGGIVIANPVPEIHALNSVDIEELITRVNQEVLDLDISGKDITPFMLQRIEELTGGNSLHTNIHLVINNAILGAQIAVEFSRLKRGL
jgi:pseudouridine-5'-phosphate glycosidase